MTGEVECRYYGRRFTAEEMALLRALIAAEPPPTRNALCRGSSAAALAGSSPMAASRT